MQIESQHARTLKDITSYRGAESNFDICLVIIKAMKELPNANGRKPDALKRFNIAKLNDSNHREQVARKITSKIERQNEGEDIQRK